MTLRALILRAAAITAFFVLALSGRPATAAFDTTQLSPGQPVGQETSTTLSDIIKNRGLTSARYKDICVTGTIFKLFEGSLEELGKRLLKSLAGTLLEIFNANKVQLTMCAVSGIMNRITGAPFTCSIPTASDVTAQLRLKAVQDAKQNFIARCVVDQQINDITNTIDRMIQEQGPEGGPAWATDWITNSYVQPDRQAYRRFWTLLVNTDICGYMRNDIYNYFNVPQSYRDNPPSIKLNELSVDAGTPFPLTGACTAPKGWAPDKVTNAKTLAQYGGLDLIKRLSEPQNNVDGFIRLANEELQKQRSTLVNSVTNQLISGGGVLPVYGTKEESCKLDADGNCITNGRIRQAPGVARDLINSSFTAQLTFLNNTNGTTAKAMEDISARIRSRMLDMANQPLPIKLELGLEDNPDLFTPAPTPTPSPGTYPPDDPSCTGGNPQCTCVRSDPNAIALVGSVVRSAVEQVMQTSTALFDPPGSNRIAPGVNYRTVLQAVCDRMQPPQGIICKPHPGQDDEIVLVTQTMSISVDVITGDGGLRSNGGNAVAACELGVQD